MIVCTQHNVDTMLKESQTSRYAVRRTHRRYTAQFKSEMVAACQQPDISIAALALQHGMNANVLHRWIREWRQGLHRIDANLCAVAVAPAPAPAFIPIELPVPAPSPGHEQSPDAALAAPADIRIECRRGEMTVNMHWPVSAATQCIQMLRELLR
jgi:transposase-like protein